MQNINNKANYELFLTDTECNFINVANRLLENNVERINKANI